MKDSNLVDMSQFKTIKELQNYCNDQYKVILKMQAEAEAYQNKIQHLEELLKSGGSILSIGSNELELCKLEISRLYNQAMQGPLEDKDVRRFEIYVKTQLAIQGKTVEAKPKKKEPAMTTEELISVALQSMPTSDEQ